MTEIQSLPAIGPATLLRALFKGAGAAGGGAAVATTFRLDGLSAGQLRRYNALLGFAPDALPVTFYYLPVQRAQLATMLDAAFPFRLAGMIHVENDIREMRAPAPGQALELSTRVAVEPPADNGARYCELQTVGRQQGEQVFECRSRYLALRGRRRSEGGANPAPEAGLQAARAVGEWSLASGAGRQYASVSGDWNPIHLWPWSARLLGMEAPIIHGMHTVGKACALLEQAEGRRLAALTARFRAPIPLGARAELRLAGPAGVYQVWAGGKLAVEGRFG